jgi:uncharacterized protein YecE (DUF72 family)
MESGEFHVGICSWTDRTLLKSGFYPKSASNPAARLAHYSREFDVVEVDATYYALPDPAVAFKWLAGTPKNFMFGVKSFSLFTFHRAKFASLPMWLKAELPLGECAKDTLVRRNDLTTEQRKRLFEDFIGPVKIMHKAGRLAYLLFQFPPYWNFCREGLVYFKRLREVSGPLPLAVEVRNNSWLAESNGEKFLRVLEYENIAYVAVDEPDIGWTVGPNWPVTAEWGTVVRFHGRNAAGWRDSRSPVHEKFNYEYSIDELKDWLKRIESVRGSCLGKKIYLMYNNCVEDKAVESARLMKKLLGIESDVKSSRQMNIF